MNWQKICSDVRFDEPMNKHTTFGVGGPADVFLRPHGKAELLACLNACPDALVIGNGSNLLVADDGIRGTVISTVMAREIARVGEHGISAECGVLLSALAGFAWRLGLGGLEFSAGIPGTVGGALSMNAGAYNHEISEVVSSSANWRPDGELNLTEHGFGYRASVYRQDPLLVALSATFLLTPDDSLSIRARMDDFSQRRREKQPFEWPSAGSAFKRPPGHYAGELIEQCGLKGLQIGGARVSEKHAGFIINAGGATCDDIVRLIAHIQQTVQRQAGVSLEPEIAMVGV